MKEPEIMWGRFYKKVSAKGGFSDDISNVNT